MQTSGNIFPVRGMRTFEKSPTSNAIVLRANMILAPMVSRAISANEWRRQTFSGAVCLARGLRSNYRARTLSGFFRIIFPISFRRLPVCLGSAAKVPRPSPPPTLLAENERATIAINYRRSSEKTPGNGRTLPP